MITGAVEFITSRKWLMELILLALIAGAVWWLCEHLISVGVQRQKDADDKAYAQLLIDKAKEEGRLQARADQAEAIYAKEHQDLVDYRASQPLHGGLCHDQRRSGVPEAPGAHSGDEAARTGAATVQPVLAGDPETGGRADPDVRHLLDVLAGRADEVGFVLREYQARVTASQTGSSARQD
jgi:hypothetical protein